MGTDAAQHHIALAVDIGGSKVEIAAIAASGAPRTQTARYAVPFDGDGAADAHGLIDLLAPHVEQVRALQGHLDGIGLSVCGNIERESGLAVLVPNLHWHNLPFGSMVADRFGLPVFAATDVRLAAQAEALWGAGKGVRNFAWVTIGTGCGAYLFLDGRIYGGAHGFAGNFGHYTIDEVNGYPCGCGRRGCLETYVAGPAIARAGQAAAESGRSPTLHQLAAGESVTSRLVFQAEALGDPAAKEIIEDVVHRLALSLGGLVTILDLELLILGGGVVHASPDLARRIDRSVRSYLMTAEAVRDLRVVTESLPNSALYGAASEVFLCTGLLDL